MYRYRSINPGLTYEQYLDEPCEEVDWALALANMDVEIQNEAQERESRRRGR